MYGRAHAGAHPTHLGLPCLVLESGVIPWNETGTSNWLGTLLNESGSSLRELEVHLASPNEEGTAQMFPHKVWTAHWRQ